MGEYFGRFVCVIWMVSAIEGRSSADRQLKRRTLITTVTATKLPVAKVSRVNLIPSFSHRRRRAIRPRKLCGQFRQRSIVQFSTRVKGVCSGPVLLQEGFHDGTANPPDGFFLR